MIEKVGETWPVVPNKNMGESDMRERGMKVTYEIRTDTPLLEPINIVTTSSFRYEISETLIERSYTSYNPPAFLT